MIPKISPIELPASILERRPDIKRALAQWQSSNGNTDATRAERFPHLSFGAGLGWVAGGLSGIGLGTAATALVGPSLNWQVFDFGRIDADIAVAESREAELLLQYKRTALTAFAQAETAFSDLEWTERAAVSASRACDHERTSLQLSTIQYQRGFMDFGTVLEYRLKLNHALDNHALAINEQSLGAVNVFVALGGGW